jgi:hypothetical protein
MLLLYMLIEHPGHTYRGFGPTFSVQGVTISDVGFLGHSATLSRYSTMIKECPL